MQTPELYQVKRAERLVAAKERTGFLIVLCQILLCYLLLHFLSFLRRCGHATPSSPPSTLIIGILSYSPLVIGGLSLFFGRLPFLKKLLVLAQIVEAAFVV